MKVAILAVLAVCASACGGARAPVVTGPRTPNFEPVAGLFAERDVQYVGNVPHCILRISIAGDERFVSYVDVAMEWCEGVR